MAGVTERVGPPHTEDPGARTVIHPGRRIFGLAVLAIVVVSIAFGVAVKVGFVGKPAKTPTLDANGQPTTSSKPATDGGSRRVDATMVPPIGGATRMAGVVPVGYRDTTPGAVAAATNYLTALQGKQILDDRRRAQILAAVAGPGTVPALTATIEPGVRQIKSGLGLDANGEPTNGGVLTMRTGLWAYHVDAYQPTAARISIWYESIVGIAIANSGFPVQATYSTITINLVWAEHDWKWASESEVSGPTPSGVANGSTADLSTLKRVLSTFTPYTYGGTR
jgi:hypothetical protein